MSNPSSTLEFYSQLLSMASLPDRSSSRIKPSRMNLLLDAIARLSINNHCQSAAVTASISPTDPNYHTDILITFSQNLSPCQQLEVPSHVSNVFSKLQEISATALQHAVQQPHTGTVKHIAWTLSQMVYKFSWDILSFSLQKRKSALQACMKVTLAEQDTGTRDITPKGMVQLKIAFEMLDVLCDAEKGDIDAVIDVISSIYEYWVQVGVLARHDEDADYDDEFEGEDSNDCDHCHTDVQDMFAMTTSVPDKSLFSRFQHHMLKNHGVSIPLEKLCRKIFSLHILCKLLVNFALSHTLRPVFLGTISVTIIDALHPRHGRLALDVSVPAIIHAVSAARSHIGHRRVLGTPLRNARHDGRVANFTTCLTDQCKSHSDGLITDEHCQVHCELSMLHHLQRLDIAVSSQYIGSSRVSCQLCNLYMALFATLSGSPLFEVSGSSTKASAGWSMPVTDEPISKDDITHKLTDACRKQFSTNLLYFAKSDTYRLPVHPQIQV